MTMLTVFCFGQNASKVDSLNKLIANSDNRSKASAFIELGREYSNSDVSRSLSYLSEAFQWSIKLGDSASLVRAGWIQAELWRRQELLDTALIRLKYILPISERNNLRKDSKRILNSLAIISTYQASYDLALDYNFRSLNLREQDGDKSGMSISYNNIGLNYFKLLNYELALKFYEKALNLKKSINDQYDLDRLLINLGLCYNNLGKYKIAKDFFNESLLLCKGDCDPSIAIEAEHGLGLSSFGLKEFKKAKEHFEKSLERAIQTSDKRNQIECLVNLSKVSFETNDFQKSKEYLDQALLAVKNTSYKNPLISIYDQYSTLADKEKDFETASYYRKLYIELRESIYSENMIKNLATIQTNFVEKENLATIESNKLVIEQQRELNLAAGCILILISIIALMFYYQRRRIRKVNENLNHRIDEATNELFESHEKLRKAVDDRDYFMYKTSHDIRGPLATFLGLCMIAKLEVKDVISLGHFDKIEKTAVKLNTILTRLLNIERINLRAVEYNFVDFKFLLEAIINLEKRNLPTDRMEISYEIEPNILVKSDKELIRIVLENLISNSIKFYNSSERIDPYVKIAVFAREDKVVIRVIDNGIGIPEEMNSVIFKLFTRASERSETGGIGLYISKQAAEKLEGEIGFVCEKSVTTFEVVLPLDMGPILRKQRDLEIKLEERRVKSNKYEPSKLNMVFS